MLIGRSDKVVRWLHISDLHIVKRADWCNFEKELIHKCQDYDRIDLVIVTGDFHDFGDESHFHPAIDFLRRLLESLNLDVEKDLFVIPGNHDTVSGGPEKEIFITAAKTRPFDNTKKWIDILQNTFQEYETFVKELITSYAVEHPASIHSRKWRNTINFIHCNTALAADGKEKTNQLLDVDTLASIEYVPNMPNIILAHNNFFDLHPEHQKRVQDVIRVNSICAYFCGDRHRQSVDDIPLEKGQVPCIVSYKTAPDPKDCYSSFGIIFGEWEDDWAELTGWCWESGKGFSEDRSITGKKFSMHINQPALSVASPNKPDCKGNIEEADTGKQCVKQQIEEYSFVRRFISACYSLSYQQREQFNREHVDMPLPLNLSNIELSDYTKKALEKGVLPELMIDLEMILGNA
ncbi:metallophosphoesterase [Acutalibacter muris]|uniref:metallophosphoesterase n=1 Tax=Acutalibacter muris TaxID=1796620 RepID=UPI001A9A6996|nr:metallophosphoesterase [Acutalibacter muris]